MEVDLRQRDLQKYLLSADAEFLKWNGEPVSQAGPAFLQGLLPTGPSGDRTSPDPDSLGRVLPTKVHSHGWA